MYARRISLILLALAFCLHGPAASHAQFDGGGMIVFDPSNFAKNAITAAQMIKQVINSTKEVELMLQNLIATGGSWEDTLRLLRRLDEVIATGEALHYQLTNLDQRMQQRYPGYHNPGRWIPTYTQWTTTSLDTLRGTLNTVREQLKVAERLQEEVTLAALRAKTEGAQGNLDVSQTGNMINLQIIEEQRKIRQLLGALINAQNVATAYQITLEAAAQRVQDDWLNHTTIAVQPYRGTEGFGPDDFER